MTISRRFVLACVSTLACLPACDDDDDDYDSIDIEELCTDNTVTRIDYEADFSTFTTFTIAPDDALPANVPADVRTNLAVANDAAAAELVALGLTQVEPDSDPPPDLAIFNLAATQLETTTTWECVPGYWWTGWSYAWDPCAWMVEVPVTYTEGTVVVGLADPAAQQVVFGGALQGVLECGGDATARIEAGVKRIFLDYPVTTP
jgi:hypothetical protein